MKNNEKWYIIKCQSNKEKSILEKIKKEIEVGDLIGKVSSVVVPTDFSFFIKAGKKVKREKIMFPGYIFVKCSQLTDLKEYIKNIPGAFGFLSDRSGKIQEIGEKDINKMIGAQEEAKKKDIENPFIIGENVKINDGPFSSMIATIDEINEDKLKLSVSIFGKKTPLHMSVFQVEKIEEVVNI
jgi:transcription termination/antitermination protein NusG